MTYNPFIFGTDPTERIVSCEVKDRELELFIETPTGVRSEFRPWSWWALSSKSGEKLAGQNHYQYRRDYKYKRDLLNDRQRDPDLMVTWEPKESAMLSEGFTYFKGMRPEEVSTLAFDIEATSLDHGPNSKVLLISNTFRKNGLISRKLFAYDQYQSDAEFFEAWANWVRKVNPSLIVGHNIYSYDLPYLQYCATRAGTSLRLGRDGSPIWFNKKPSEFRKDGSNFYEYTNAHIYGREIVDTWFLSMRYDFSRKYDSYGLKYLVKTEGLEVVGRQHYDAAQISRTYKDPAEWAKIKAYAEHDADDALSLFDLMVPAYFYLNRSVPKPFQAIINGASGAQLNSFLIRSYLQIGHSIPKASAESAYEGAISIGNPGVYRNVFKVDVASLYPSIILQYEVYDREKDPNGHFLKMVDYFTDERLTNKKLAKETGDPYYSALEQAQKIFINSAYGMLGTPGLSFNSPSHGAFITKTGRDLLTQAMDWAIENDFLLVNADTDSISICCKTLGNPPDRKWVLEKLNARSPTKIKWEDDGIYDGVLVLKAKNYCLERDGKRKIKGSALKATTKEPALKEFIARMIDLLLTDKAGEAVALYNQYVVEIHQLQDISRWAFKRTVTENVMNGMRTNETKVLDALGETHFQMGDKFHFYYDVNDNLKLVTDWQNDHSKARLLKKLWDTAQIFETVLDTSQFLNYSLKRKNQKELQALLLSAPF